MIQDDVEVDIDLPTYNLQGQRTKHNPQGLSIQNGKVTWNVSKSY